jgi:hypothetical protein
LGLFNQILEQLAAEADTESVMIDASIVSVHQHGAGAKGGSKFRLSDDLGKV